jgi:ubiquinone/menaquinone biosynthesis C-methylase UbiE
MNIEVVKDYYGKVLKSSGDLKTSACCDGSDLSAHLKPLLANVHEEVRSKYYGCGLLVPAALEGARVLDLGSGSGRDVYLIAQLVGASGEAVGVDMTDEQLATAQSHIDWHAQRFGYARPNVRFLKGYIEKLGELGLEPASFDLIVSNCVINLSIDRPAVLRGAYDLLKPGGELYFARRPTGCSSSTGLSRLARTKARQSSTRAACLSSPTPSSLMHITWSKRARSFRFAAIRGACSPIRGFVRTSISSGIAQPTMGSFPAAARHCRSLRRRPRRRRPVGAVADAKASSGAFKGHLRSGRCFGFRLTTRVGLKT